jgi:hypothetical protein
LSITEAGITHEYSGEFADIQTEFENEEWDIPVAAIRLAKKHEKQYREEFEELKKRVEDEIRFYDGYWPDEEEIGEYFRSNEVEFVISENEVERVAMCFLEENSMFKYEIRQDEDVTVSSYRKDHWWTVFEGTEEHGFDEIAAFREQEDVDNFVKEKEKCQ